MTYTVEKTKSGSSTKGGGTTAQSKSKKIFYSTRLVAPSRVLLPSLSNANFYLKPIFILSELVVISILDSRHPPGCPSSRHLGYK